MRRTLALGALIPLIVATSGCFLDPGRGGVAAAPAAAATPQTADPPNAANQAALGSPLPLGRLTFQKKVPASPPKLSGYEYIVYKMDIVSIGGASVTSATTPGAAHRLLAALFGQTESVFVGLRFSTGAYEVIQDVGGAPNTTVPAIPFITVLQAARNDTDGGLMTTNNGVYVLGPRLLGGGQLILQLAVKWGTNTETTIPGSIVQIAKSAVGAFGAGVPTLVATAVSGLTNNDRQKANQFFNSALSFKSDNLSDGGKGPDGINSQGLTADDFKSGTVLEVHVYDRDARDSEKKEIIGFTLTPSYWASVLGGPTTVAPDDAKTLFVKWTNNGYKGQITQGAQYVNTTVDGLLNADATKKGQDIMSRLVDDQNFDTACGQLETAYARLGFNEPDQEALTWGLLMQSTVLNGVKYLSPDADKKFFVGSPDCPTDQMGKNFAAWGLPPIKSPLQILNLDPASSRMQFLNFALARAWSRQGDFSKFFDPNNQGPDGKPLVLVDQTGTPALDLDSPAAADEFVAALTKAKPTTIGSYNHASTLSSPASDDDNVYCMVVKIGDAKAKGAVTFSGDGSTYINRIQIGQPAGCPLN